MNDRRQVQLPQAFRFAGEYCLSAELKSRP
jgi:hypothetical protein